MATTIQKRNEFLTYVFRFNEFSRGDWQVYVIWVGMMIGLFATILGFLTIGSIHGVEYPAYVWNVPIGTFIFSVSIAIDTIGHRTIYKEELSKAESLVHHITIFAGIASCVLLTMAYTHREFLLIPTLVMIILSVFYSVIDECMHWKRYFELKSDRVEMWSHFGIFVGHMIMIFAW